MAFGIINTSWGKRIRIAKLTMQATKKKATLLNIVANLIQIQSDHRQNAQVSNKYQQWIKSFTNLGNEK